MTHLMTGVMWLPLTKLSEVSVCLYRHFCPHGHFSQVSPVPYILSNLYVKHCQPSDTHLQCGGGEGRPPLVLQEVSLLAVARARGVLVPLLHLGGEGSEHLVRDTGVTCDGLTCSTWPHGRGMLYVTLHSAPG